MNTTDKLRERVRTTGSRLCVGLDLGPHNTILTVPFDGPLGYNQHLIEATGPHAAAFKFQMAGYLGMNALDILGESIAFARIHHPEVPVILDGKFSDIAVSLENYGAFAFDVLNVDAVTANPYLGGEANTPLLERTDKLVYFLCSTSNPGSGEFQEYGGVHPLYLEVAEHVSAWNTAGNCGLVIGATHPDRIAAIRAAAPGLPFLMPGLGTQGAEPSEFLPPALTDDPSSVVINVSRGVMHAEDPAEAAAGYVAQIRNAASIPAQIKLVNPTPVLLDQAGCVQHGEFTLASGQTSDIYIDLRLLSGHPAVLSQIGALLHRMTRSITYDAIVTIPTAGLPIGTALALHSGKPLLYVRKEAKDYGRGKWLEGGTLEPGQRALLIDDVISTGGSKFDAIERLREAGVRVEDVAVIVDRRDVPGGNFLGASVHALVTLAELRR